MAGMEGATLITHRSQSVGYYLRPYRIPALLWQHRSLIRQLVGRAVAARYRGSVLGILWSFILPLTMLMVYTFVFSVVLKARWSSDATGETHTYFALTLFCGLLVYNLFAECIAAAPGLIAANVNYVKRVVFPLEILPVVALGAALVNALISLIVLLAGLGLLLGHFPITLPYFLLALVPLLMLTLGLSWFLASVGVYVRDTGYVISVLLQMLFFLTPLFYPISRLPGPFQIVMRLNPLTVIVEDARRTLMQGQPPDWVWFLAVTILGIVLMQLGYVWFMKTKRGFADVL